MKALQASLTLVLLTGSLFAQSSGFQILSLGANGHLAWTNTYPNGLYGVEWASSVNGPWQNNWTALQSMVVTGQTATVDVPMFYRVKCATNLFMPMPMGGFVEMTASNAVGAMWTERMTVAGSVVLPSKGKEYTVLEGTSSQYPGMMEATMFRSTSNALYSIASDCGMEDLGMTNAPVGTSWTKVVCGETETATIEASELVTVPLGTFNCLRVRKQGLYTSHPNPVWIEWWAPGFGMIQWMDYYVDPSENPPIVYRLSGRSLGK